MALPNLNPTDIQEAFPTISDIGQPARGGQKLVFPCTIEGRRYALKVMLAKRPAEEPGPEEATAEPLDEVLERARREVSIMRQCNTPHLVQLGPIPLGERVVQDQNIIYFTEEWIDGQDVKRMIRNAGPLPVAEVVRLGVDVARAVDTIWQLSKVHRDVKPGNIIRRNETGAFVLLDMGLAFDLHDLSLTDYGFVAGTQIYLSPEQTDFAKKRLLDFRRCPVNRGNSKVAAPQPSLV